MKKGGLEELARQSTFYNETYATGESIGKGESISSVLATRFGSVPDRIAIRIYTIREGNAHLLDDLLKLAVTAEDIGEFEAKLGEMGGESIFETGV